MMNKLRPLAALAAVALIGAGCSNADSGTSSTASAASGTGTSTKRDEAVKFSECMRDNGVSAFPDPDASGELTLDGAVNGSSIDPNGPAWTKAISACKHLQPSGFAGHTRSASQQQQALAFARCIREHGVKDFPDPVKDQPLIDTRKIPSANVAGGMTILNAAMHACRGAVAGLVTAP
jgi:hypothetical protein